MFAVKTSLKRLFSLFILLAVFGGQSMLFAAKKKTTVLTPSKGNSTTKTAPSQPAKKPAPQPEKEETTPAAAKAENTSSDNNISSDGSIKLSTNSYDRNYFAKIDKNIMKLIEDGSPEALRSAMQKIRKSESEYTENERILIAVAAEIMQLVWPSEKVTWNTFPVSQDNPYTGAINSAKKGVLDTSTGNVDFLTTLLPALVLVTTKTNASLTAECEKVVMDAMFYNYNSTLANYLAGIVYERQERFTDAESYYSKAYLSDEKNIELTLAYSKILGKVNKVDEAKKVLAALSSDSTNVSNDLLILKQNAYIAFDTGNLLEAEEYVAKVLQQTPNDLEFVLFRAKIFIAKNDYIHAVSLLDMYARQNDTNIDYLILRAKVQLDWSKNTVAATDTVEKALQLYPNNEDVLMIAAKISATTDSPVAGKYADELAGFVLANNPNNTEALMYAVDGLIQRENWVSAYSNSSVLIKKMPLNPEIVLRHVSVCLKLGKKAEALEVAGKAYAANSNDETIMQAYVYAYTETNSTDASVALIEKLMPSASQKMKSYLYYRRSFLQRNEDSSLADLRSSLIANPRNSEALFRLYEIYFTKHDYRKAQYYLRQVVALNPSDSSAKKLNEALTQLIQ